MTCDLLIIQLTPLDFAKFGELHRNRGRWDAKNVIASRWIDASLRPQIETTVEGNRYGFLWWHKSYAINGKNLSVSYCSGNGGNKIFVFDDPGIVVVVTASAYGQRYMHTQVDEMMTRFILPAIVK